MYLLRKNTIQDRADQLSSLTMILAEHAAQTMFSANVMLDSMVEIIENAKVTTPAQYNAFASQKEQFKILSDKTNSNPIIDVATFVGKNGEVLNFSREFPPPSINLSDRDYFQWLSVHDDENTFYSLPVQNKGNGEWVFYLARRISNTHNDFLGVALVGVSVEVFTEIYQRIAESLGEGTGLSLYRNDKTLLLRWPEADGTIGKVNNNLHLQKALDWKIKKSGIFYTDETSFTANTTSPERMISIHKLEDYPLLIAASMTKELYLTTWLNSSKDIAYTTIFSLAVILTSLFFLINAYLHNREVQHLAEHDNLTSLPNRLLLADRTRQALAFAKRNHKKFALIYIDLDHFKVINDTLGHDVGDAILSESAKRMLASVRSTDTVSRVGGDEFVIILYDVESSDAALRVAENIHLAIGKEIDFQNKKLNISASIGISIFPEHGEDVATLQKHADIAMYMSKKKGRNKIQLYNAV